MGQSIFITAFIITTVFWGYMALAAVVAKETDKILVPALWGILVYFVADKLLKSYISILVIKNYTNLWTYAIVMGLTSGLCIEIIRNETLYCLNKYLHWSGNTKDNAVFAIGYGWGLAIHSIGLYALSLYSRIVKGTMYFEIDNGQLFCHFLEALFTTILCIGMTFILQYGIIKRKKIIYTTIAVILKSISEISLYAGYNIYTLPRIIVELKFAIFAIIVFFYGYGLMVTLRRKQPKTYTYKCFISIIKGVSKIVKRFEIE